MSIKEITKTIEKHDKSQEQARVAMDKALSKFDEKKALKFGAKYIKEYVKKYLKPIVIAQAKDSFKVSAQ